ncbi:helix-turn-helix domain-containing protein [Eubacteriaceae bacterium ES3]|nr:helix-turn-helix domain-containing protein [Eubacteriaceae bacterium ES3]
MDCFKVGALLKALRKEKGMTQKQVGQWLHLSDKTISKWERGMGCPDVSLLSSLSELYQVNVEKLMLGDLELNEMETGNMKRTKFYVCKNCQNIITTTGDAEVSCCGRKLTALLPKPADEVHQPEIKDDDGDYYISFDHEMTKTHFIAFAAIVSGDRRMLVRLYPEQTAELRLPKMVGGKLGSRFGSKLYYYCSDHGLFVF